MELHPHGTKAQPPTRPEDDEAWPDDEVYWEWDDYEAEGDEALDGEETYYYDAENDTNPIDNAFNVDEYDAVFASYIDAKNLNRMRTSRGFYPVVAMVQQPPLRDGGKGGKSKKEKGKSSKGKGKPPSSRQMNSPQRGSAKSRAEALGKSLCLCCGVAGHQAKNCPASGDRKRKADNAGDEDDVRMAVGYDESFSTQDLDNLTDRAVQDGGAASVLGSRKMVGNYIKLLEVLGVNIHKEAEVFKCQKGFKYGNSQKEITNSAASFRPTWEDNGGRSYATPKHQSPCNVRV